MHSTNRLIGLGDSFSMRRVVSAVACAAALAACAKGDNKAASDSAANATAAMRSDTGMTGMNAGGTATGATTGGTSTGAATGNAVAVTSDAEIMSVISMSNANEIGSSKLAQTKATSADVKSFAKDMVSDHTAMQADADKLAKNAKITPTAPSAATQLKAEAAAMMDSLKTAKGATFDQQYMAGEVADHQKTLDNLRAFQGQAQSADLKNMIQQAIPKVQQHLDRARDIQGKLGTRA